MIIIKITFVHSLCNKPAFYYAGLPRSGDAAMISKATYVDGSKPKPRSRPYCSSCHQKGGTVTVKKNINYWLERLLQRRFKREYDLQGVTLIL